MAKEKETRAPSPTLTPSWSLVQPSLDLVRQSVEQILFLFLLPALLMDLGFVLTRGIRIEHVHELSALTSTQQTGIVLIFLAALWSLVNLAPSLYFRLRTAGGTVPSLGESYRSGLPYLLKLIGLNIVTTVVIFSGFLLLIVPGLIFLRRYYLAEYYLIDRNVGVFEAMRLSSRESKPVSGYVWGILSVQFVFAIIASFFSVLPVIGVVASAVVGYITLFLPALRYHEIKQNAKL